MVQLIAQFQLKQEEVAAKVGKSRAAVANARLYGLPADYVQTYRVKVGAVSSVQVQTTARATIRPQSAVIVVVGIPASFASLTWAATSGVEFWLLNTYTLIW